VELNPEDEKLILLIRSIKYGQITVKLRDSKPVLIECGVKTIKLESNHGNTK